jgi:ferredoxin
MITHKYIRNVVTLKLDVEKCSGCKMCTIVCPHQLFVIQNKKAQITDVDLCMECGACTRNCPEDAIQVRAGVGCAAGVINGILNKTGTACC